MTRRGTATVRGEHRKLRTGGHEDAIVIDGDAADRPDERRTCPRRAARWSSAAVSADGAEHAVEPDAVRGSIGERKVLPKRG